MKKEKYPVTKRWKSLSKDEKVTEVRDAMAKYHSNRSAAELLGTTPGAVAGIRHRNKIPALFKKGVADKPQPKPKRKGEVEVRTREDSGKKPTQSIRTSAPTTISRVAAASEHNQCKHVYQDKHRCGYEKLPGSDYCGRKHSD